MATTTTTAPIWSITCDKGREAPVEFLQKHSTYPLNIEQITTGDYAIQCGSQIIAIIERKTWADLAASIKDPKRKANHQKLLDMRYHTGCSIFYIIEGRAFPSPECKIGRMPFDALQSYLDHVMIRDGCHVIHSANPEGTALRILALVRHTISTWGAIKDRFAVEETLTTGAAEKLKVRHHHDDDTIRDSMLMCMVGVTAVSAPVLKAAHISMFDVLRGDVTVAAIAELKYPSGGRFGDKRAQQIIGNKNNVAVHAKILSAIPGLTQDTAKKILKKYSIVELVNTDADDISEIVKKITNGKPVKVGPTLAEKIKRMIA